MQLTLKLPIHAEASAKRILRETMSEYTQSFNRVCQIGWQEKETRRIELHKKTYYQERKRTKLPSQLICSARVKATEALASVRSRINRGKRASQPRSERCPMRYDARSMTINLDQKTATLATLEGRQKIVLAIPKNYEDKVSWKVCSADLCLDRQGRMFLHVVVEKAKEEFQASGKVIGVDFGIVRPAVTSDNDFLGKGQWKEVERKGSKLRTELQAKGTKSAKRHLKKLSGKENRFRRDCDHVLAKQIVMHAEAGTVIALENLTDIRSRTKGTKEQRRRMHSWSFRRLGSFIEYKASLRGAQVQFIDPRYTSQQCSRCNYRDKNNRQSQSWFSCRTCHFQHNADLNAAKNIRSRHQASEAIRVARWAAYSAEVLSMAKFSYSKATKAGPVNEPIAANPCLAASQGLEAFGS